MVKPISSLLPPCNLRNRVANPLETCPNFSVDVPSTHSGGNYYAFAGEMGRGAREAMREPIPREYQIPRSMDHNNSGYRSAGHKSANHDSLAHMRPVKKRGVRK